MDNTGNNTGQAVFRINKDQTSASEFIEKWESKLRSEYGEAEIFLDTIVQGPPVGAPVTITVSGEDIDELSNIRDDLKNKMLNKDANIVTDNLCESDHAIEIASKRDDIEDNNIEF